MKTRLQQLRLSMMVAALAQAGLALAETPAAEFSACEPGATSFGQIIPDRSLNAGNSNLPPRASEVGLRAAQLLPDDGRIVIAVSGDSAPADGVSALKVGVRIFDAQGNPLREPTRVTLESERGQFQAVDADNMVPGVQVVVQGGAACVNLVAPHEAGDSRLRASSGRVEAEGTLAFVPDLRPMIAVGIVEGQVNLKKIKQQDLAPATPNDGFEEELRHFGSGFDEGKGSVNGRAAVFLKGKIKGDALLTLSYDSEKPTRDKLFRDINPEQFYPVYGDASIKGFEAQSSKRLYVRVDKGRSYLLYGDFHTQEYHRQGQVQAQSFGQYSRSLTGAKGHYEDERVSVTAFATRDSLRQMVEEQPGRGISGPYSVSNPNGVANSERVEIITRDRNQPSVILRSVLLVRYADYDFEPFSGRILFRQPVPGVDENLNPVSIRVSYEVDQGGPRFWIGGLSGQVKLTEGIAVGGSYVMNDEPRPATPLPAGTLPTVRQLKSVNTTIRLGEQTYFVAEAARSEDITERAGNAARVELRHDGEDLQARVLVARTDPEFVNPSAPMQSGRAETSARATYRVTPDTDLVGEAVRSEDRTTDARRDAAQVALRHRLTPDTEIEAGVRRVKDDNAGPLITAPGATPWDPFSVNAGYGLGSGLYAPTTALIPATATGRAADADLLSARLKVSHRFAPNLRLFGEAEVDTENSRNRMLAVGGDYLISERTRLYGRHEFVNTLGITGLASGTPGAASVLGLATEYMRDGQLFSEYRLRDAIEGREAYAAMGLRNLWTLGPGLRLHTALERQQSRALNGNTAHAAAVGFDYTADARSKFAGRLEFRQDVARNFVLSTLAADTKLDRDWTLLTRNYFATSRARGDQAVDLGMQWQDRFQIGVAWRQTDRNEWHALGKYEFKVEEDSSAANTFDRRAHILSAHFNYQPELKFVLSGRVAGKWVDEMLGGVASNYSARLVSGRAMYDVTPKWDVGVLGSVMWSSLGESVQRGIGVETGYRMMENLWASVGYNFTGFSDRDLVESEYTRRGWFLRLRFKFNEDLFGARDPQVNRAIATTQ